MTDEETKTKTEEQSESEIQARYQRSLVAELKRLNSSYKGLEESSIETLEALKQMELERLNSNQSKPKPFTPVGKKQVVSDTKEVKNEELESRKFNRLQMFHAQYTPISTMPKWKENCTILGMAVNADPRWPEWQVS